MKHIKLFENYIISKKLFGLENLLKSDTIDSILDWGLDFLKQGVSYLMKNDLIIELLQKIKPDLLKEGKVRLIFPLQDWESDALEGLKKSGIVTGVFKKTNEAIDFIEKLTGAGIKIKELILGSHGSKDLFFIAMYFSMFLILFIIFWMFSTFKFLGRSICIISFMIFSFIVTIALGQSKLQMS